jgi:hypothetical protein
MHGAHLADDESHRPQHRDDRQDQLARPGVVMISTGDAEMHSAAHCATTPNHRPEFLSGVDVQATLRSEDANHGE